LLVTRLLTAALGIPILIGIVWVGGALLAAIVALAAAVASIEFAMARSAHKTPLAITGAICAAAIPLIALAGEAYVLGGVVATIGLTLAVYTRTSDPARDLESWLWSVTCALYFGGLGAFFVLLREAGGVGPAGWTTFPPPPSAFDDGFGRDLVFFTLITVWVTDTGAYFVGRAIGRHKLAPAISPNKTIEGGFGSLAAGFAAVFALNEVLGLNLAVEHRVALGLLLPPVIMVGDLAESALKRALGVKDSSGLVPGHGGIADRLDSLLFAAPLVYYYLKWVVF
jgi:phosphatidate cytidylyltransferase